MTLKQSRPPVPRGLKAPGRQLWDSVNGRYELEPHESSLLLEACQTLDIAQGLQGVVDTLGLDCAGRELAELRQQRLVLARLLVALQLPGGLAEDSRPIRTQRRGVRGVYRTGGA
jgi:hypothetical protein